MPAEHLGKPGYEATLTPNVVTVASLLQDSGYRTHIAGKWNVGFQANHVPLQAPQAFIDKYRGRYDAGWTALRDARRARAAAFGLIPGDTPMVTLGNYAAWSRAQGVLPMPEGYHPVKQVLINSFVNYWIPTYRNTVIAVLAGLTGLVTSVVWMRRRRQAA